MLIIHKLLLITPLKVTYVLINIDVQDLYANASKLMETTVNCAHQWVDMSNVTVKLNETHSVSIYVTLLIFILLINNDHPVLFE